MNASALLNYCSLLSVENLPGLRIHQWLPIRITWEDVKTTDFWASSQTLNLWVVLNLGFPLRGLFGERLQWFKKFESYCLSSYPS